MNIPSKKTCIALRGLQLLLACFSLMCIDHRKSYSGPADDYRDKCVSYYEYNNWNLVCLTSRGWIYEIDSNTLTKESKLGGLNMKYRYISTGLSFSIIINEWKVTQSRSTLVQYSCEGSYNSWTCTTGSAKSLYYKFDPRQRKIEEERKKQAAARAKRLAREKKILEEQALYRKKAREIPNSCKYGYALSSYNKCRKVICFTGDGRGNDDRLAGKNWKCKASWGMRGALGFKSDHWTKPFYNPSCPARRQSIGFNSTCDVISNGKWIIHDVEYLKYR